MMKPNIGLVATIWTAALFAMLAAALHGSLRVVLGWSAVGAGATTLIVLAWPARQWATAAGAAGVMWQLALAAAHWPPAWSLPADVVRNAPGLPPHVLAIGGVLLALASVFVVAFVLPGVLLWLRIGQAARVAQTGGADTMRRLGALIHRDHALRGAWQEYLALIVPAQPGATAEPHGARASARTVFEPYAVASTRLRLEFFRNLPGVFTGIGIIGTFSGLILGLRGFVISEDPAVMQRSLSILLTSVWESFGVSALAIGLAIIVTVVEKLLFGGVASRLAWLASALDAHHPPQPAEHESDRSSAALLHALKQALEHYQPPQPPQRGRPAAAVMAVAAPAANATLPDSLPETSPDGLQTLGANSIADDAATQGVALGPSAAPAANLAEAATAASSGPQSTAAGARSASAGQAQPPGVLLHDLADSNRQVSESVATLLRQLPELFSAHLSASRQQQEHNTQALKSLSGRLETVAAGIESSGRRTLEFVSQRLVDAETTMLTRHQAVAEQMQELVQRIEVLCGVLQQDREFRNDDLLSPFVPGVGNAPATGGAAAWPVTGLPVPAGPASRGARSSLPDSANRPPSFADPQLGNPRFEWDLPPGGRGGFGP